MSKTPTNKKSSLALGVLLLVGVLGMPFISSAFTIVQSPEITNSPLIISVNSTDFSSKCVSSYKYGFGIGFWDASFSNFTLVDFVASTSLPYTLRFYPQSQFAEVLALCISSSSDTSASGQILNYLESYNTPGDSVTYNPLSILSVGTVSSSSPLVSIVDIPNLDIFLIILVFLLFFFFIVFYFRTPSNVIR